tara:strand:+ start:1051 stop:1488 length:438 start_codon:yes stop_codon:yes gene_type:complete
MDAREKKELENCRNVLIQSNDPRFNFNIVKEEDIDQFQKLPQIITLDKYDYGVVKDDGDDTRLPEITPLSLLNATSSLEDMEEFYRQKHPNLPDEYFGVMARYSAGQPITKKEAKNSIKKYKKKPEKSLPVGFSVAQGNFKVEFD